MSGEDQIALRRGSLHFKREVYERFFDGLENVVLLRDGGDLLVLPVRHGAAGGYVVKLRNSRRDRVVSTADFLRDNGVEDHIEVTLPVRWDEDRAALIASGVFSMA